MKKELHIKLQNCTTLNEVIRAVDQYYNLDQPLGVLGKMVVLGGMEKILKTINAKER